FRSIVVPIKAVIMNVLSVGAAYGLLVLVFQNGIKQLDFDASEDWNRMEDAIAEIRDKYGDRAVSPARLLDRAESTRPEDQG
ncbi:MAG: hypothetical protein ACE1Z0_09270, partial [Acidimicrobiia bacterium]